MHLLPKHSSTVPHLSFQITSKLWSASQGSNPLLASPVRLSLPTSDIYENTVITSYLLYLYIYKKKSPKEYQIMQLQMLCLAEVFEKEQERRKANHHL